MTVYRPNTIEYTTIEVDLVKKPGKGLGLSVVARKSGKGVYIADIVSISEIYLFEENNTCKLENLSSTEVFDNVFN